MAPFLGTHIALEHVTSQSSAPVSCHDALFFGCVLKWSFYLFPLPHLPEGTPKTCIIFSTEMVSPSFDWRQKFTAEAISSNMPKCHVPGCEDRTIPRTAQCSYSLHSEISWWGVPSWSPWGENGEKPIDFSLSMIGSVQSAQRKSLLQRLCSPRYLTEPPMTWSCLVRKFWY